MNQRHCENHECINPQFTCSTCWQWMKEQKEAAETDRNEWTRRAADAEIERAKYARDYYATKDRLLAHDRHWRAVAEELGVTCGGVDVPVTDPKSTAGACIAAIRGLGQRIKRIEGRLLLLTGRQARLICDAHVDDILGEPEREEALALSNPKLLEAYYALHRYSVGAHEAIKGKDEELFNGRIQAPTPEMIHKKERR